MSIGAGENLITMNIDAVTGDEGSQDLRYGTPHPCIIDLHNAIPGAGKEHIRVLRKEFGAEDAVGVTVKFDAVRCHSRDLLAGQLIVKVDGHVLTGHSVLEAIAGEVAGEEAVVLLLLRVLQLACERIPMVDLTIR